MVEIYRFAERHTGESEPGLLTPGEELNRQAEIFLKKPTDRCE
jgi:hypothetical protein